MLAGEMVDTPMGWSLLSVISELANSGQFDIATMFKAVSGTALFLAIAFAMTPIVIDQNLSWVDDHIALEVAPKAVVFGLFTR